MDKSTNMNLYKVWDVITHPGASVTVGLYEARAWMNDYTQSETMCIISHPCSNMDVVFILSIWTSYLVKRTPGGFWPSSQDKLNLTCRLGSCYTKQNTSYQQVLPFRFSRRWGFWGLMIHINDLLRFHWWYSSPVPCHHARCWQFLFYFVWSSKTYFEMIDR